ncbi:MAG: SDR family oxidoreductase [Pirellulales bacterium]
MKYLLLTGATGLVGRYLLRDLVSADVPVAVLCRGNRVSTARDRIEVLMQRWDGLEGRALPRPVVLEADLRETALGLSSEDAAWISANVGTMLHNAASMTFREDKHGEPFRTNNDGMRNVLEMCRSTGIRKFHHVSTAYVCGLRNGRVYERELDLGQENGNVYEVSKLLAEKMVRAAEFLDEVTIYRPASVVGDSATGYTVSSHGFYLPLQLAYVMADKIPTQLMGDRFFRLLGLRGDEGKNLVPVDWLSAAIVHLVLNPEHHCQTYHMTNPQPVTVRAIQEVIQEAIEKYSTRRFVGELSEQQIVEYEALFQHYMEIYRSHWRDDPLFDRANTDAALPDLPCPMIDYEMLLRIASYPVKENFVLKRMESPEPCFQPLVHLQQLQTTGRPVVPGTPRTDVVGFEVTGRAGGQWRLVMREGVVVGVETGLAPVDRVRYHLNSHTFSSLVAGSVTAEQSVRAGRVLLAGGEDNPTHEEDYVRFLQSIVSHS